MKNLFNKKLFAEAYRQIKVPFALFLGLMLGITGLVCFVNIFSAIEDYKLSGNTTVLLISDTFSILVAGFIIIVPVFTFKLFKFLNKRNASDFYHAIPITRKSLMFTYSVAIFIFATVILVITALVPIIAYGLSGKYITFNINDSAGVIVNSFVCMVLSLGLCLLSSSLTGTFFTNLLFLALIAFGPRLIITILTETLTSSLGEIITYYPDFGFFSSKTNMIFYSFANELFYYTDTPIYELSGSTIYTLLLGILYIVLAFIAFNKRKSEQAENSSQNPIIHHTIRTSLGFFFCLIATIACYSLRGAEQDYLFIQIIIYVFIALAAMVSYELFTSKKFKSLSNLLISAPIIIVLCIISYFSLTTAEANILAYKPTASDIDYIKYSTADSHDYYDNDNYFDYMLSNVEFDDKELITLLTEALSEEIDAFKEYQESNSYNWFPNVYGKTQSMIITFVEGNKEVTRVIYLNDNEYEKITELLTQNEDYQKAYFSFPEEYEITYGNQPFTNEEIEYIMKVLEEELPTLSHEQILATLSDYHYPENLMYDFECRTVIKSKTYYFNVRLSDSTPNTLNAIYDIFANKGDEQERSLEYIIDFLDSYDPSTYEDSYFWLAISIFDRAGYDHILSIYLDDYSATDFEYNNYNSDSYEDYLNTVFDLLKATNSNNNSEYIVQLEFNSSINNQYKEIYCTLFADKCNELENLLKANNITIKKSID